MSALLITSTHDLTKRSTKSAVVRVYIVRLQLTTSRRGRPFQRSDQPHWKYFNSRPHEEVDRVCGEVRGHHIALQLTTSRRGRRILRYNNTLSRKTSTHDLTKRSTARRPFADGSFDVLQLTTSRRGRLYKNHFNHLKAYFNSRPHEEVDLSLPILPLFFFTSTHDLTKRSTSIRSVESRVQSTSTHDLTKRSTAASPTTSTSPGDFNSRPHEEVDDAAMVLMARDIYFNSRPHEEVDLFYGHSLSPRQNFNSRPHEEVDVMNSMVPFMPHVLQLTTSRRGRRNQRFLSASMQHFNSRPHEEVDFTGSLAELARILLQLTTSRRGRLLWSWETLPLG